MYFVNVQYDTDLLVLRDVCKCVTPVQVSLDMAYIIVVVADFHSKT